MFGQDCQDQLAAPLHSQVQYFRENLDTHNSIASAKKGLAAGLMGTGVVADAVAGKA